MKCQICGFANTKFVLKWKIYQINKCPNCNLLFATPLPSLLDLEKFYQGFLFRKPDKKDILNLTKKRKVELIKLFDLTPYSNFENKFFLDYGGGTGVTYNALLQLGFNAYYSDVDRDAAAFTQENFGLTTEKIIYDIKSCKIKFDYIFSNHVIEHVNNPIEFVSGLASCLNAGGILVIKTPHGGNSEVLLNIIVIKGYLLNALKYNSVITTLNSFSLRFWHCDPPRHLYSFTKKSLTEIASKLPSTIYDYEIQGNALPIFSNTLTHNFLNKDRVSSKYKAFIKKAIFLPFVPFDVLLQLGKYVLLRSGILTPGEIVLKIKRRI
jgi:2-polyprenyl-3-methyl-5-hydroxy-6-metoxy-1,4-benzoquinol methylase